MPTVAMIVYGEVEHDSRVRRATTALIAAGFDVSIGCLSPSGNEDVRELDGARVIPVAVGTSQTLPGDHSPFRSASTTSKSRALMSRLRWLRAYGSSLRVWRAGLVSRMAPADLWLGHDLFGVWAAAALQSRSGGRLVYDSHELFLEAGSAARLPGLGRALLARMEGRLARRADAVITVNGSIAEELHARYGVRPVVVLNVPGTWRSPTSDPFRSILGLGDKRVILYHGALSPGRGIEQLVEVAATVPPERVVVVLGDGPLFEALVARSRTAELAGRLVIHPAVPIDALPDWVGSADVGVVAFQATTRNNVLGTPNKLFDYLVAGVPVVVSDFPEMRTIVEQVGGGQTCDPADPRSIVGAIDRILSSTVDEQRAERERLARDAGARFAWSVQAARLVDTVRGALDG